MAGVIYLVKVQLNSAGAEYLTDQPMTEHPHVMEDRSNHNSWSKKPWIERSFISMILLMEEIRLTS